MHFSFRIFLETILIQSSLDFFLKDPIGDIPALFQIMTLRRMVKKLFPELIMVTNFTDAHMASSGIGSYQPEKSFCHQIHWTLFFENGIEFEIGFLYIFISASSSRLYPVTCYDTQLHVMSRPQIGFDRNGYLTRCVLVSPVGDIDLGQHWLRQ